MNLSDLYQECGRTVLRELSRRCGVGEKYLYQCATGRRVVSPALAKGLVAADRRLTLDEIYRDVPAQLAPREEAA